MKISLLRFFLSAPSAKRKSKVLCVLSVSNEPREWAANDYF